MGNKTSVSSKQKGSEESANKNPLLADQPLPAFSGPKETLLDYILIYILIATPLSPPRMENKAGWQDARPKTTPRRKALFAAAHASCFFEKVSS